MGEGDAKEDGPEFRIQSLSRRRIDNKHDSLSLPVSLSLSLSVAVSVCLSVCLSVSLYLCLCLCLILSSLSLSLLSQPLSLPSTATFMSWKTKAVDHLRHFLLFSSNRFERIRQKVRCRNLSETPHGSSAHHFITSTYDMCTLNTCDGRGSIFLLWVWLMCASQRVTVGVVDYGGRWMMKRNLC